MVWQLADPALLQDIMVSMQVAPEPAGAVTYSIRVKASCSAKKVDGAPSLFQQLRRFGLAFDEVAFNTLLPLARRPSRWLRLRIFCKEMRAFGIAPTHVTI